MTECLAAAVALVTLGAALCYPVGWDDLVYHQVLPERWLADGYPAFYRDLPYSGFPSLGEILFWLMAPVDSVIAPRLLIWLCWILALICLYRLLRKYLSHGSSLAVTLAFTLNDTVLLISQECYVESVLLLDFAALLLAIDLTRRSSGGANRGAEAVILGVLAGGAAGVKLVGVAVLGIPCLWYLIRWRNDRSCDGQSPLGLAIALATALGVSLPFYLRPWLATGNPFYPYFSWWFTDDPARVAMSQYHHALGGFAFGVKSLAAFVDAPLLLAFRADNYDGEFGWQLLLLVGCGVAALVAAGRSRRRRLVLWPAAVALWLYVFWFATAQQARFAVPAFLAFVLVAGSGVRFLHGTWRRLLLAGLMIATLVSVPWVRAGYYFNSWRTALGLLSRTDYVHNATDGVYLPLIQVLSRDTPRDAKLMLLCEHRGFYMPRPFVIGTPLFQEGPFTLPEQYSSSSAIRDALRRDDIDYVVLAKTLAGPDRAPGWLERQEPLARGLEACLRDGTLRISWESAEYVIFKVQAE